MFPNWTKLRFGFGRITNQAHPETPDFGRGFSFCPGSRIAAPGPGQTMYLFFLPRFFICAADLQFFSITYKLLSEAPGEMPQLRKVGRMPSIKKNVVSEVYAFEHNAGDEAPITLNLRESFRMIDESGNPIFAYGKEQVFHLGTSVMFNMTEMQAVILIGQLQQAIAEHKVLAASN
jgi:hypothetical protein